MAQYIEAPYQDEWRVLFLGGGITGTEDWQAIAAEALIDLDIVIMNPRRKSFDISKKEESVKQIAWEYRQLRKCDECLFYFPSSSICPITLFELGSQLGMAGKRIFIGTDPSYTRRMDIEVQVSLIRPDIVVASGLSELIDQVRQYYESRPWIIKH